MQSMNLNGMQVIVLSQPGLQNEQQTSRTMKPRLAKQLIGLGVVHILNGVFCIIFQSISLEKAVNYRDSVPSLSAVMGGQGLWTGLPYFVTGIIGVSAGIRKSNCQAVAFNILSIISASLATYLTLWTVTLAVVVNGVISEHRHSSSIEYNEVMIVVVMTSMLAAVAILEVIIAIWSAIVCCIIGVCSCCCLQHRPQTQPLILNAEQQAALMSNQQQMTQYDIPQANAQLYGLNDFLSAVTVDGAYTGLNTVMNPYLTSSDMDAPAFATTSFYDELHDYDEIPCEQASELVFPHEGN